jgi:hypothetical protein
VHFFPCIFFVFSLSFLYPQPSHHHPSLLPLVADDSYRFTCLHLCRLGILSHLVIFLDENHWAVNAVDQSLKHQWCTMCVGGYLRWLATSHHSQDPGDGLHTIYVKFLHRYVEKGSQSYHSAHFLLHRKYSDNTQAFFSKDGGIQDLSGGLEFWCGCE